MKATWNGAVIAESDSTVVVEGNHYFPPSAVNHDYLRPSTQSSVCPWKGTAAYYDVVVDGETNKDAAWHYDQPKERAENIREHIAFWRGVTIEE